MPDKMFQQNPLEFAIFFGIYENSHHSFLNLNKHEMNFIPNKHELKRVIFIQKREFPEHSSEIKGSWST